MISMNRPKERLISVISQLKVAANNRPVKTRNNPPIGASSKFAAILFGAVVDKIKFQPILIALEAVLLDYHN